MIFLLILIVYKYPRVNDNRWFRGFYIFYSLQIPKGMIIERFNKENTSTQGKGSGNRRFPE